MSKNNKNIFLENFMRKKMQTIVLNQNKLYLVASMHLVTLHFQIKNIGIGLKF